MKNIFNKITENKLNSFLMLNTIKNSSRENTNTVQFNDDLYLSDKIKFLDRKMSILKKMKQEFLYKLPEKKNLQSYQKNYPFLNSYQNSGKIVNVTSRNLSYTINHTEYNLTSRRNDRKLLLTEISPSRSTKKTHTNFNFEEYQNKKILEDNIKKLKKMSNYTAKVKKLHNFNFILKESSLTQRNPKKKFVPNFDFKRIKHHKNERRFSKKIDGKHFKKKSSIKKGLEHFFLTDLTSASIKELYPDAISISKENDTKHEIGILRDGLEPVRKRVILNPARRNLEKIYKTNDNLEGKIKEVLTLFNNKAKLDKSIPLENYQNKLLKLVEKSLGDDHLKNLRGKFYALNRITKAIKPLPAFKVEQVFDKENYLNELNQVDRYNFKKNRNPMKKFVRIVTLPTLN